MARLYLDLETVPANDIITDEDIANAVPKNYSKPETIVKWINSNKNQVIKSIIKKRSLNHYECKIICLSYSFNGEKVQSITGNEVNILKRLQVVIEAFLKDVSIGDGLEIVGHNIKEFDAPIIFLRAAKYKLLKLHDHFNNKKALIDTMYLGTYFNYKGMVSLDTLCTYFDIQTPKGEMDGSKVYDAYKEGRIEDIANYCNKDVEALIAVHNVLSV